MCGGCGLQTLPYAEQLSRKSHSWVARLPPALRSQAPSPPLVLPVFPSHEPPWRFRQKVAFVFGTADDGRMLVMGHFARGSNRVVPVEECPVHSARGNRIAFALRDELARAGVKAAGPALAGLVRHVLVRTTRDDREAVAMLVVTRNDKTLRKPVRALLASPERPDGFFINVHDAPGPYMVGRDTVKIEGRSQIREEVGGFSYLISPTAFFQTNVRAAEALQAQVMAWLPVASAPSSPGSRILELYAGNGLFSLPLVAAGAHVVAVEENRQAARDLDANLRLNHLSARRLRCLATRVEDAMVRLERDPWDAVLLDPPRQGCPEDVRHSVFRRIAPACVVYVSCNPDALAAELPFILDAGYRLDAVRLVDMFPHTGHLEAVVRFVRA